MSGAMSDVQGFLTEFPEAQLQIRDKLPYNYLLSQMILTFQKAILNIEYSAEELREAVEGFVNMIPRAWRDEDFSKDLEAAVINIQTSSRPVFNEVPASDEYCKRKRIQTTMLVQSFDYFKVFNAVINLLNRRHMLLKQQYKEIMTGRKGKKEEKEYAPEAAEEVDAVG